jgi:hypothetical protein
LKGPLTELQQGLNDPTPGSRVLSRDI